MLESKNILLTCNVILQLLLAKISKVQRPFQTILFLDPMTRFVSTGEHNNENITEIKSAWRYLDAWSCKKRELLFTLNNPQRPRIILQNQTL